MVSVQTPVSICAGEGRGAAEGQELRGIDAIAAGEVERGQIGGLACGKLGAAAEAAHRRAVHEVQKLFERENAGLHEVRVAGGEGRFKTDDAHGAGGEAAGFFFCAVRGVVGGDHVDRAVEQALDEGVAVGLLAQGRVHFEAPVLLQIVLGEDEVVRTGLARHIDAAALGLRG